MVEIKVGFIIVDLMFLLKLKFLKLFGVMVVIGEVIGKLDEVLKSMVLFYVSEYRVK